MDRSNNFLKSIQKHSEEKRAEMLREIDELRTQEIAAAKEKGEADAQHYINKLLSKKKSEITSEYAVKNLEAQGEILKKRDAMVNEIFEESKKKLRDFTTTADYKAKLIKDAEEISALFSDKSCVVYIKSDDMKFVDDIKAAFNSDIEIKTDVKILIGGLRAYCEVLKLVADNTLDSKLEAQREWFVENAKLKVK